MSHCICVAVADLRNQPRPFSWHNYSRQILRESQLLFGEKVEILHTHGEWSQVAAIEQTNYLEEGWKPYLGWVHQKEIQPLGQSAPAKYVVIADDRLSYGTLLLEPSAKEIRPLPPYPRREQIVAEALKFLNFPYLWGGRSLASGHTPSSVDCSGLINLLYRAQGMHIPRNTYDQSLFATPTQNLLPGDPLYLAKANLVNHVILKLDDTTFIEAPKTGQCVRLLRLNKHLFFDGPKVRIFDRHHLYTPFPRTFLSSSSGDRGCEKDEADQALSPQ